MSREPNEEDLRRLGRFTGRWLLLQWRLLIWRQQYVEFPFPMKLAVGTAACLGFVMWLAPVGHGPSLLILLSTWMGAFCFGLMIAALSPCRPAGRIHWLQPVVDEEREELRWE